MNETVTIPNLTAHSARRPNQRMSDSLVPKRRSAKVAGANERTDLVSETEQTSTRKPPGTQHCEAAQAIETADQSKRDLQQFVNSISHDLRTPLRSIAGFSDLLLDEHSGQLDGEAQDYLNRIVEGVEHARNLLDCITEYARIDSKEPQFDWVEVNEIVEQVIDELHPSIRENNATVSWAQLPNVIGDTDQLRRVFRHLIDNSINFRSDDAPQIDVSFEENESGVAFTVCDNGIGIPGKHQADVFTMFRRLRKTAKEQLGLGAGLTICQKIVQRHGGTIEIDSQTLQGTRVTFSIPSRSVIPMIQPN